MGYGLAARDGGADVVVEIDGAQYVLRSEVGFYAREQASVQHGYVIRVPFGDVAGGQIAPDKLVEVSLERQGAVVLKKLWVWLKSWSHKEPLTEETLKRLLPSHAKVLLRKIGELERENRGPSEDSPLGENSTGSSPVPSATLTASPDGDATSTTPSDRDAVG